MKLTLDEYREFCDEQAGYCSECDDITNESEVEPDAEDYRCPECGNDTLMGAEQAQLLGHIEIKDTP